MKPLWERVLHLRTAMGDTQEAFAARIGVAQPTVGRWESRENKGPPAMINVDAIVLACGITRGQFWADDFPASLPPRLRARAAGK